MYDQHSAIDNGDHDICYYCIILPHSSLYGFAQQFGIGTWRSGTKDACMHYLSIRISSSYDEFIYDLLFLIRDLLKHTLVIRS